MHADKPFTNARIRGQKILYYLAVSREKLVLWFAILLQGSNHRFEILDNNILLETMWCADICPPLITYLTQEGTSAAFTILGV